MLTFHESYGTVSVAQLRAYKKYNVSQSDHDLIVQVFGEDEHAAITSYVIKNSEENGGMFSSYSMWRDHLSKW